METIHLLIVSDNHSEIAMMRDMLETGTGSVTRYHVEVERDPTAALRSLVRNTYDVYLVDQIVPNSKISGVELVKKANAGGCRSPVLLLTTMPDEDVDWALDDAGAAGHVHKHLDFVERTFRNAIREAIRHHKDVTDIQSQLRQLQSQIAELIHLFNRR